MNNLIKKAQEDSTVLILLTIISFLLGLIIGFVYSPIKNGMTIASNNTIVSGDDDDEDEE